MKHRDTFRHERRTSTLSGLSMSWPVRGWLAYEVAHCWPRDGAVLEFTRGVRVCAGPAYRRVWTVANGGE